MSFLFEILRIVSAIVLGILIAWLFGGLLPKKIKPKHRFFGIIFSLLLIVIVGWPIIDNWIKSISPPEKLKTYILFNSKFYGPTSTPSSIFYRNDWGIFLKMGSYFGYPGPLDIKQYKAIDLNTGHWLTLPTSKKELRTSEVLIVHETELSDHPFVDNFPPEDLKNYFSLVLKNIDQRRRTKVVHIPPS